MRISIVSVSVVLAGCAFDAGNWFSTLDARLEARTEVPESRNAGDGWQTFDTDYELRIERASLELGNVELLDEPDTAVSDEHAQGADALDDEVTVGRVAVSLPVGDVDLLGGEPLALDCVLGCGLPRVHLVRARVAVRSVAFEGRVRDSRTDARIADEPAWRWNERLDVEEQPVLEVPVEIVVERDSPPETRLVLTLVVSSQLFDGIDWSGVPEDEGVRALDAPGNAEAIERLHAALADLVFRTDAAP